MIKHDKAFGVPMVAYSRPEDGLELLLRADVDLAFGTVRLAVLDATKRVRVWRPQPDGGYEQLLDSEGRSELFYSIDNWMKMSREILGICFRVSRYVVMLLLKLSSLTQR